MLNAFFFVLFLAGGALSVPVSLFQVTDTVTCETEIFMHENIICIVYFQ